MSNRKQFQNVTEPDKELLQLLEKAKKKEITETELQEQRISFAFGNAPAASTRITKDSIRCASKNLRLLNK